MYCSYCYKLLLSHKINIRKARSSQTFNLDQSVELLVCLKPALGDFMGLYQSNGQMISSAVNVSQTYFMAPAGAAIRPNIQ